MFLFMVLLIFNPCFNLCNILTYVLTSVLRHVLSYVCFVFWIIFLTYILIHVLTYVLALWQGWSVACRLKVHTVLFTSIRLLSNHVLTLFYIMLRFNLGKPSTKKGGGSMEFSILSWLAGVLADHFHTKENLKKFWV